ASGRVVGFTKAARQSDLRRSRHRALRDAQVGFTPPGASRTLTTRFWTLVSRSKPLAGFGSSDGSRLRCEQPGLRSLAVVSHCAHEDSQHTRAAYKDRPVG